MTEAREGRSRKRFFGKSKAQQAREPSPAPQLGQWGSKPAALGGRRSRSLGHGKSDSFINSLEKAFAGGSGKQSQKATRKVKTMVPPVPLVRVARSESDTTQPNGFPTSPRKKGGRRTPRDLVKRAAVSKSSGTRRTPNKSRSSQSRLDVAQELSMEGPLHMRFTAAGTTESMDLTLFWCSFRDLSLSRFVNEEDEFPVGVTLITPEVQVEQQASKFSLSYPSGEKYECMAESFDAATLWTIVLRKAVAASAQPSTSLTRTLSKTGLKRKNQKLSKTRITPRAQLYAKIPIFESCCTDFAFVLLQYEFSPTFVARKRDDDFYHVEAGKVRDLVAWFLVHSTQDMKSNKDFSAFLLCYDKFCSPAEFVQIVQSVWKSKLRNFPYGIEARLINFLRQYLLSPAMHQSVKEDLEAKEELYQFCTEQLTGIYRQHCLGMLDLIKLVRSSTEVKEEPRKEHKVDDLAEARLWKMSSNDLVQLLTEQEEQLFSKLEVSEFINQRWQKQPELAPNLVALAANFNKVSCWTAHSILSQPTNKDRARMFAKFVRVAKQLLEIGNYQTGAAVLSGVRSRPVERLSELKEEMNMRHVERMEKLAAKVSPEKNYAEYRTLPTTPPCIPFLAVYLRDLTFIDEGNSWFTNSNKTVCNFVKADLMAACLRGIALDKTAQFCFQHNEQDLADLRAVVQQAPSEEELYQLSVSIEPFRSQVTASQELASKQETIAGLEQRVAELEKEREARLARAASFVADYRAASGTFAEAEVTPRSLLEQLPKEQLIDLLQDVLDPNWKPQTDLSDSTSSLGCGEDSDDEETVALATVLATTPRSRDVRKGLAPTKRGCSMPAVTEVSWDAVEERPAPRRKIRVTPRSRNTFEADPISETLKR